MAFVIIGGIILFLLVFNIKKAPENNSNSIKLTDKYSLFIKYIKQIENGYLLKQDNASSFTLTNNIAGGYSKFRLTEGNIIITLNWESQNFFGKQEKEWIFSIGYDQAKMYSTAIRDIKSIIAEVQQVYEKVEIKTSKTIILKHKKQMQIPNIPKTTKVEEFEELLVAINYFYIEEVTKLYSGINDYGQLSDIAWQVLDNLKATLNLAFQNTSRSNTLKINKETILREIHEGLLTLKSNKVNQLLR